LAVYPDQDKVNFQHNDLRRNFSPEINTAVYRIVQEALTNVARYAKVTEVEINIQANEKKLSLTVEDHGSGFDVENLAAKASTGLSGMRERARLLGGWVTIEANAGVGTKVEAEIPLVSESPITRIQ
jgi:signal transduction histidine kinase